MNTREFMHDRLHLNVAVSGGGEIFGWRGDDKLSSSKIDAIVQGGPVSSGSFVGFINNIFTARGVEFTYKGRAKQDGVEVFQFSYRVPQEISAFRVFGTAGRSAIVGFHGSISANRATFELVRLRIIADKIPYGFGICATDNQVRYQLANISGTQTLIPRSFELHTQDQAHLYTVSRSEYSQCHEFRAQSTLRFDDPAVAAEQRSTRRAEQWLPAGLDLRVALAETLDEKKAYAGDPVEAVLTEPSLDAHGRTVLPRDTRLRGIITKLETFYQPDRYQALRIEFNHASFAGRDYSLRAIHKPTSKELRLATGLFDGDLPDSARTEIQKGTIYFQGFYLRLDRKYQGEWQTVAKPANAP